MKKIILCNLLVLVLLLPACTSSLGVYINEVAAINEEIIADSDGDYEDWLELYNGSSKTVNLSEYYLSDDENEPLKWKFPEVNLAPGEFLLVWASGKDRSQGELHTNFSLKQEGEPLILSGPQGNVVDRIRPVTSRPGQSFGRNPDGGKEWHHLSKPSPGTSNQGSGGTALIYTETGLGTITWIAAILVIVFVPLFIWFWRKTRR